MIGPGKYDDLCTELRERSGAKACFVIIIDGKHGEGFACQTEGLKHLVKLPAILHGIAVQIEKDIQKEVTAIIKAPHN